MGTAAVEIKSGATVSSDYFASLNRVAELVPDVSTKIVVYGGTARQSRSDVEVVPVSEFGGVLERFDVEQEVAEFVTSRSGITPAASDVETLDAVYRTHIRPTLDELTQALDPVEDALFRSAWQSSHIKLGPTWSIMGGFLKADVWERTKEQYFVSPGFALSNDRLTELGGEFTLSGYTGKGGADFSVSLSVIWQLAANGVTRSVSIDGDRAAQLDLTVPYSELNVRGPELDRVVAEVMKALMARIASLSTE